MTEALHPESVRRRFSSLPGHEKARLMGEAEEMYGTTAQSRRIPWADLPEISRQFAAVTVGMVKIAEAAIDPIGDTYRCSRCFDTALVSRPCGGSHRSKVSGRAVKCNGCDVSWYCTCEAGEAAESGYWYGRIYPERDGRRQKSDAGEAEFLNYLRSDPSRSFIIRSRVDDLKRKYESARSRKLEAMEGSE